MDTQMKKKDNAKSIKGLIKIISLSILVVGLVVYTGLCLIDYLDKFNKEYAIKIEQTQENIKIAENMVEKELNVSSKYFKMVGKRTLFIATEEVVLNTNTESSWIDKDLTCEVQVNGENYSVIFETQRVDNKNEEIEMYEPVKINKIIKEH
ncbi:hypothetical protein IAW_05886 [Bacillus cereus str. Schrouff]|uniref:hypothetical protein n=1 Tax=Bacillus cereus TaxID=1396 RepID=UPI00032E7F85|nr:hypothetical protein [Bacillus cereus]EOO04879.1 hypothetical protein IAW_05886 [Bacillus cereus str. Schrouff]EOO81059.1 hypothetical protein IGY_06071 [Bacillus cereus K-5975c]